MQKCNMCLEKLDQGKQTSCVVTCPCEALKFGTIDNLMKISSAKAAERLSVSTAPAFFISGRLTEMVFLALLNSSR